MTNKKKPGEKEVVGEFIKSIHAWRKLRKNDPRKKIYDDALKHKYGDVVVDTFPKIHVSWEEVFMEYKCPVCTGGLVRDGDAVCSGCEFRIPKKLYEKGLRHTKKEIKQRENDAKTMEALGKKGINIEDARRLYEKAMLIVAEENKG